MWILSSCYSENAKFRIEHTDSKPPRRPFVIGDMKELYASLFLLLGGLM
jgi:hypothetical protein